MFTPAVTRNEFGFFPRACSARRCSFCSPGLIVSHAVGSWIYTADREQAVRAVGGFAAAQRIANLTRLVQEAPREWRERIVAGLERSDLSASRFRLSLRRSCRTTMMRPLPGDQGISRRSASARRLTRRPRVVGHSAPDGPLFGGRRPMMGRGPMMHGFGRFGGFGGFRDLQVAIPLPGWPMALLCDCTYRRVGRPFRANSCSRWGSWQSSFSAVSVWAVRRVTAPLASLSVAAERLGNDLNAPPMPETGTIETRQAPTRSTLCKQAARPDRKPNTHAGGDLA